MSSSHHKRGASRASLPRRSTKGPLEDEDPLSASFSPSVSPVPPPTSLNAAPKDVDETSEPLNSPRQSNYDEVQQPKESLKDLSFLLDTSIYHSLSSLDSPPPFKESLPRPPSADTTLTQVFSQLEELVRKCHFLPAAHLAASTLVSNLVVPTDTTTIFRLLSIRFSSLELSGNVGFAAQESKALEDLSSMFYYRELMSHEADSSVPERRSLRHVMPFDLRLQATRLQSIGFGDSRRAVGALFDLGLECRNMIADPSMTPEERSIWRERLEEIGIRVINALVDMGDLDCAKRTLETMKPAHDDQNVVWKARLITLLIKMGEISTAQKMLEESETTIHNESILKSLIALAGEDFEEATTLLSEASETADADQNLIAIAKQNLAVVYLYTGEIQKSRKILEDLVDEGYSFRTLTVNLATLYDLMSDKSKDLKMNLVDRVSSMKSDQPRRSFVNADFKL